jgi:hypothetical protein
MYVNNFGANLNRDGSTAEARRLATGALGRHMRSLTLVIWG